MQDDTPGGEYLDIHRHKTAKWTREPVKRTVPLVPEALEIIERQVSQHAWRRHVFLNEAGKPYTAAVFRQRLKRWCERAGIRPRSPYALRHTFGSAEAEAGVNQAVLAQIMGHTQLRTTARYINHNAEHHRKAIAARLSRFTNGRRDTPEAGEGQDSE